MEAYMGLDGRAALRRRRRSRNQNRAFIAEWNEIAHPFDCKRGSFRKVLDRAEAAIAKAA